MVYYCFPIVLDYFFAIFLLNIHRWSLFLVGNRHSIRTPMKMWDKNKRSGDKICVYYWGEVFLFTSNRLSLQDMLAKHWNLFEIYISFYGNVLGILQSSVGNIGRTILIKGTVCSTTYIYHDYTYPNNFSLCIFMDSIDRLVLTIASIIFIITIYMRELVYNNS